MTWVPEIPQQILPLVHWESQLYQLSPDLCLLEAYNDESIYCSLKVYLNTIHLC